MPKKIHEYPGADATVRWDGRLCIHVGECGRAANALFETGRKPWCQPDAVATEAVEDVVARCPTGALTIADGDGARLEEAPDRNEVMIANNGPLYLTGDLAIDGAGDDQPGTTRRAALCRCGQSKNKPFCDGAHEAAGFVDRGAVGATGEDALTGTGPLVVKRVPNGPLLVNGPCVLRAASGRVAWLGTKAALCRCGASANKPFCDGSHKAAGFEAE